MGIMAPSRTLSNPFRNVPKSDWTIREKKKKMWGEKGLWHLCIY